MPYRILTSQVCSSFQELLKTLFSYPSQAVFHGKNHEIKSALNFCPPLYLCYDEEQMVCGRVIARNLNLIKIDMQSLSYREIHSFRTT